MTRTSYHNHTTWSDGLAEIPALVTAAAEQGLEEVGISDHYVLTPRDPVRWSIPIDRLSDYVAAVRAAAATAPEGLVVRVGIEADFFPETVDTLRARLAEHRFDYVIGSVHFVNEFPIDEAAEYWQRLSPDERDTVHRYYWERLAELARSGVYDIVAHLDLPKKFGFRPRIDLTREIMTALDAIAAAGMTVEINTAGWDKDVKEAYPTPALLHACYIRGIPLQINADAHSPAHLTRNFDRAAILAWAAGYREVTHYAERKRTFHPFTGANG